MKTLALLDYIETPAFAFSFPQEGPPQIIFWNARAEEAMGLPRNDVLGQVPSDAMGTLAEPLMSPEWLMHRGQVAIGGLGMVHVVPMPDERTIICTVLKDAHSPSDGERETFIGMAIHDARAPLRNINFLCEELLVDFEDPGDGRNHLVRKIRAIADQTLSMSDDILTAVHAASLQSTPSAIVDLQPLCDMVFATLDPMGKHRLVSTPAVLELERPVLQVVLRNLIDNAIRHGARDDALSIEVRVDAQERGFLVITVVDDGAGIPDEALNFLASGEVRRGSGFGLYGVQRLVESRGGHISARRLPDQAGSAISITLPGRILTEEDRDRIIKQRVTSRPRSMVMHP